MKRKLWEFLFCKFIGGKMKSFFRKSIVIFLIYTVVFTSIGYGYTHACKNVNYSSTKTYKTSVIREVSENTNKDEIKETLIEKVFKICGQRVATSKTFDN